MRLGQLSRKLDIKAQEIIDFIQSEFDVTIKNHPNCKVEDEFVPKVKAHFAPVKEELENIKEVAEPKTEAKETLPKEDDSIEKTIKKETSATKKTKVTEKSKKEDVKEKEIVAEDVEQELNIDGDVIKAPKVEVPGLKVVGKIDIPEKKEEKEEVIEEETKTVGSIDTTKDSKTNTEDKNNIDDKTLAKEVLNSETKENKIELEAKPIGEEIKVEHKQVAPQPEKIIKKKPKKEEISYEDRKKIELERYEKKRAAEKKRLKDKQRKNYEKLMQEKALKNKNTPKNKKKKKKIIEAERQADQKDQRPAPKTAWGKFLRWLNT